MAISEKHTLIELFTPKDDETIKLQSIEIPSIQRDYAQGRANADVTRIRVRFLSALYDALTHNAPITLDFVYGDINSNGKLIPLDGQQRLTTLFLLHWYIARHEGIENDEIEFLSHFSYATRYSAREFCKHLVGFIPADFTIEAISDDIIDQSWMPIDWQHDPTIRSMLTMLDDIHIRFKDTSGLWPILKDGAISFYFLALKDMGLTDELYIKMNSRGKPLTEFEHFKAEWENHIGVLSPETKQRVSLAIDTKWTDILWAMRTESETVDSEFVRYFRFLCDILRYRKGVNVKDDKGDIFDIEESLFGPTAENVLANVDFIEKGFNCWISTDPVTLFDTFLTTKGHTPGKVCTTGWRKDDGYSTNLFEACCRIYGDMLTTRARSFQLGHVLLLYAFIVYLQNKATILNDQFARRIRFVVNLTKGSEFEMRDDRMARNLAQVERIILTGSIPEELRNGGLNEKQINEELAKNDWLVTYPDLAESLFKLEDHELLYGAIRAIGLDHIDWTDRFYSLFKCNRGLVNRALLTQGDYSMSTRERYQLGSVNFPETTWRLIFRNSVESITNTRNALLSLLGKAETFTDEFLQSIIDDYLASTTQFDWRYYFIKYPAIHLGRYGMFRWNGHDCHDKSSYNILSMWTEKNISGRNWNIFLRLLSERIKEQHPGLSIHLGSYAFAGDGDKLELTFAGKLVAFENNALIVYTPSEDPTTGNRVFTELSRIQIRQTEDKKDIQDRIDLAYNFIKANLIPS